MIEQNLMPVDYQKKEEKNYDALSESNMNNIQKHFG
jgi:hypothetical protein